ncbi:MAG TPA: alginate lyase family protein [Candidatus Binatia bacterium]|nr:alginate lyase family protein [Candidatus Binatia bacterium]
MESWEILSRLADAGRHLALRASHRRTWGCAPRQSAALSSLPFKAPTLSHGCIGSVTREEQDLILQAASNWLKRRASFFSLRNIPLGDTIDWQRNYLSGVAGPKKYAAFINHRDAALIGDVKYVWELNRLQHLVLLALASIWTGQENYEEEIVRQTLSWSEENPFMMGLNWKSPLEAALRLISWAYVSCLTGNKLPDVRHNSMRATLYQHQYFISKFYSKHSSANNHLIGEMAGLYVASIIWPFYQESSSWQSLAKTKLLKEIVRQVEADGVGKERAIEYQLFILEFLLMAASLGQRTGDPFPEEFWRRLRSMLTFLSAISDRNGNLPMFGDGDSGQVVGLPDTTSSRVRALVRLGRRLHKPVNHPTATDVRSRFLLWGESENIPVTAQIEDQKGLQTFPGGGYYVLSAARGHDDEIVVVFDAAPLGLPPLYAHGHADALSFWLSYGGHEFFVDPGTFSYYTQDSWRAYFRSTAAHNTIRIDGYDQSIPGGRFLWSHVANSQVDHTEENNDFVEVEARHDGYRRLTDPVMHRRRMRLYKQSKKIFIEDTLHCRDRHDIEIFFHFNESCRIEQTKSASYTVEIGEKRLHIQLDLQLQSQLLRGSENPILGWVSRTYGIKKPSFTLVGRATLTGSKQLETEIEPL